MKMGFLFLLLGFSLYGSLGRAEALPSKNVVDEPFSHDHQKDKKLVDEILGPVVNPSSAASKKNDGSSSKEKSKASH